VKAKKAGKAVISATVDVKTVNCHVSVKEKKTQSKNITINNTSYTVYITKTGECYHRDGCRYLRRSQISISKSSAINQGYRACHVCHP